MKKLYQFKLITVLAIVFASVTLFSQSSFGQESIVGLVGTEAKLSQLVNSQNRIAVALEGLLTKEENTGGQTLSLSGTPSPYGCLAGLGEGSTTYAPLSEWNFDFIKKKYDPNGPWDREIMQDLNGDGMLDYMFLTTDVNSGGKTYSSCVYLNDGNSFELHHVCSAVYSYSNGYWLYFGDCEG